MGGELVERDKILNDDGATRGLNRLHDLAKCRTVVFSYRKSLCG